MKIFTDKQRQMAEYISELNFTNPFLPERIELEKQILGSDFHDRGVVWSRQHVEEHYRANITQINAIGEALLHDARKAICQKPASVKAPDFHLYEHVLVYFLFNRYLPDFYEFIIPETNGRKPFRFYRSFCEDLDHFLGMENAPSAQYQPDHLFAIFYQVHRAFYHIFDFIVGSSLPMATLRASIWQSIFTHDLKRYNRSLFRQMRDFTTLIHGPSGTGKELVARAVSFASYLPFSEEKLGFSHDFHSLFFPLQLSAMSQNLIESELFGHRKGAYTGALTDRTGWLENCPESGTVFLDEIGEINEEIQVKLLRVLQTRTFQRLGDDGYRQFRGKIIAATNRDLAAEMVSQQFRSDLYYRLCSDMIATPTLKDQLESKPDDLQVIVRYLAEKLVNEEEAETLAAETLTWINRNLGNHYQWPGNVRELEQCVRNILIRGSYTPVGVNARDSKGSLQYKMESGLLTAEELMAEYCAIVYKQCNSYTETARRLGLDRRTAKKYIDLSVEKSAE